MEPAPSQPRLSPEFAARLGSIASDLLRQEAWQSLAQELNRTRESLLVELVRGGQRTDDEKRAMIFVVDKVLGYPHRLMEQGAEANKALHHAQEQAGLRKQGDTVQAVEIQGWSGRKRT